MKLIEFTEGKKVMVRPKFETDKPVFIHCAGGMEAVTYKYFRDVLSYVFMHHGITDCHMEVEKR